MAFADRTAKKGFDSRAGLGLASPASSRAKGRLIPCALFFLAALLLTAAAGAGWLAILDGGHLPKSASPFPNQHEDVGPLIADQASNFQHIFHIQNTSASSVSIQRVDASCGCSSASVSKRFIAPGEQFQLTLHANLASRHGPTRLSCELITSRGFITTYAVDVQIIPRLFFQPQTLDIGQIRPNTAEQRMLILCAHNENRPPPEPFIRSSLDENIVKLRCLDDAVEQVGNGIYRRSITLLCEIHSDSKGSVLLEGGNNTSHKYPSAHALVHWGIESHTKSHRSQFFCKFLMLMERRALRSTSPLREAMGKNSE